MIKETKKYLQLILPSFNTERTKEIFQVNPTVIPKREEAAAIRVSVFDYNNTEFKEYKFDHVGECFSFKENNNISWINIDGIRKPDVESVCNHFNVHYLLIEDIL